MTPYFDLIWHLYKQSLERITPETGYNKWPLTNMVIISDRWQPMSLKNQANILFSLHKYPIPETDIEAFRGHS